MLECVSVTGKPAMERVSKESGERELEDATGQLKAGNEGQRKTAALDTWGKHIGR